MDRACGEGAAGGGFRGELLARGSGERACWWGRWAALPHTCVVGAIPSRALSTATPNSQRAE